VYLFHVQTQLRSACTFLSRFLVTPHHRCIIMREGVDESLHKMCNYQQNVTQQYYLFDNLVILMTKNNIFKCPCNKKKSLQSLFSSDFEGVLFA